jgi:hypothetical protein
MKEEKVECSERSKVFLKEMKRYFESLEEIEEILDRHGSELDFNEFFVLTGYLGLKNKEELSLEGIGKVIKTDKKNVLKIYHKSLSKLKKAYQKEKPLDGLSHKMNKNAVAITREIKSDLDKRMHALFSMIYSSFDRLKYELNRLFMDFDEIINEKLKKEDPDFKQKTKGETK